MPLPDIATLDAYVARKLLTRRDLGSLSIWNYTDGAVYSGAWDAVTLAARGLILDRGTGEIVARPFGKFFNYGEYGVSQEIPGGPPDVTCVKYDGALGILFRHEGRIRWTTRGNFGSPHAAAAQRIWDGRYAGAAVPEEFTVLTEIIAPETRNIVYYDFTDLVLLGICDRFTGKDLPYGEVAEWAGRWGMPLAETVEGDLESLQRRAQAMDARQEGFVARWGDYRLKVKSRQYLELARTLQGLTERRIGDLWYAGEMRAPPPDLPAAQRRALAGIEPGIPEELCAFILGELARLEAELAAVAAEFEAAWALAAGEAERRAVVERLGVKHPLFHPVLMRFSGKPYDLREIAYLRRFGRKPRQE